MATGRIEDAERSLAQALAVHKSVGNREMEGVTFSNLGGVYKIRGNKDEAIRTSEKALKIHEDIGNPGGEGVALNNLGVIYNDLAGDTEAIQYYKRAYYTLKNAGKRWETGRTLYNIGVFYRKQPKHNTVVLACLLLAKRFFEEAQSPDLTVALAMMDHFAQDIGKKEYNKLLAICEQNAQEIVEQALRDV